MLSPTDRRQTVRLPPSPCTSCDLLIEEAFSFTALAVPDISKRGVGLVVDVPVPIGQVLTLQLNNLATRVCVQRPARVVYCVPAAGGGFSLGTALAGERASDDLVGLCDGGVCGELPVGAGNAS